MDFYLEVTKNELLLREIIGDRDKMYKYGSQIIRNLLNDLMVLDKAELVVQDI
jgi:hypothetical protein